MGRLSGIVRKLLLLSLADGGQLRGGGDRLDLGSVVAELVEDGDVLAPDLTWTVALDPQLTVAGVAIS